MFLKNFSWLENKRPVLIALLSKLAQTLDENVRERPGIFAKGLHEETFLV